MLNEQDRSHASQLNVTLSLSGSAFHEGRQEGFDPESLEHEVARILRVAADGVLDGQWLRTSNPDVLRRPLRDINGNTVGAVVFTRNMASPNDPQED